MTPVTVDVTDPSGDPVCQGWLVIRSTEDLGTADSSAIASPWIRQRATCDVPIDRPYVYFDTGLGRRSDVQFMPEADREPMALTFRLQPLRGVRGDVIVPGEQPFPEVNIAYHRDGDPDSTEYAAIDFERLALGRAVLPSPTPFLSNELSPPVVAIRLDDGRYRIMLSVRVSSSGSTGTAPRSAISRSRSCPMVTPSKAGCLRPTNRRSMSKQVVTTCWCSMTLP